MSKVYQSVRGVVQGTLQRRKPYLVVSTRVKDSDGSLNGAIEELEKAVVERIGKLKAAVCDDQAVVASEAQHAEQVIERLKANITVLEARLRETEDTVHKKDAASQKMEESLSSEIRNLQSVVKKKEEALESRNSEVKDLKSRIDALVEQVSQSELAIQQAKAEAASEAQHAEQVIKGLKANITVLEARLRETEETLHKKDAASQKMEESLSTQIRDLHNLVKKKQEALGSRDSEVSDLESKIDVLIEQVAQSGFALQQAKAEATSEAQRAEQVIEGLKIKTTTLQAQLSQTEQIVAGLVQSLASPSVPAIPPTGLDTQLEPQTNGMKGSKAEALVDIQEQVPGTVVAGEQLKEKSTALHLETGGVTPIETEAERETVSQEAFDLMTAEFSEITNVMGSIASLIVRGHVRAFGESMEEFPQRRLRELLECLSKEISDDKLKAEFCERFGKL